MDKKCLTCSHYKGNKCYSKDFNRVVKSDVLYDELEGIDCTIDTIIDICEPDEFYCCYWR